MTLRTNAVMVACGAAIILAMPIHLAAQSSLTAARQLYASAEYQDALTMLDGLRAANPSPQDRQSIELYRTFCLVAVGNMEEANSSIEAMISRDPLYRPNSEEVPPRLRAVFSDARKRLLPSIIQQKYVIARAAFDRNDYKVAAEVFTQVLIALSDPDIAPVAGQPPLADLRVLASSFNDLTLRAMAPPPTPVPLVVAAPAPAAAAAAAAAVARAARIYSGEDADVTQPVALRQEVPPYPGRLTVQRTGVVEIVIDETGAVSAASMAEPLDPSYNRLLLAATKTWAYRPARFDGAPVKYRKRIQIAVSPRP